MYKEEKIKVMPEAEADPTDAYHCACPSNISQLIWVCQQLCNSVFM